MTSFIQREIDRTTLALRGDVPTTKEAQKRYDQMWIVQQALAWALDPANFRSPVDTIDNAPVVNGSGGPA